MLDKFRQANLNFVVLEFSVYSAVEISSMCTFTKICFQIFHYCEDLDKFVNKTAICQKMDDA